MGKATLLGSTTTKIAANLINDSPLQHALGKVKKKCNFLIEYNAVSILIVLLEASWPQGIYMALPKFV